MKKPSYVFTGGGTGGHVYPAIAIADEILKKQPDTEILYIGNKKGAESHIIPKKAYRIKYVPSVGLTSGILSPGFLKFLIIQSLGFIKSIFLLLSFRPTAVIGTGGYVSAPVVLANLFLRKIGVLKSRIIIHEQNVLPGRLNELVARFSDLVILSSAEAKKYIPKGAILGYPVRKNIEKIPKDKAKNQLNIPKDKKVVFAFGGSTGARTINRAVIDAMPIISEYDDIFVIHGIGKYKSDEYTAASDTDARIKKLNLKKDKSQFYLQQDYFYNIDVVYSASDLIVARAGAGTIQELKSASLPSLIIPKANLPGDHQVLNAKALENSGACEVIYEDIIYNKGKITEYVDGRRLAEKIIEFIYDKEKLMKMGKIAGQLYNPDSLNSVVTAIFRCIEQKPLQEETDISVKMKIDDIREYYNLGAYGLLKKIQEKVFNKTKNEIQSMPEWNYLTYRSGGYLASDKWEIRNIGVKLIGLLKDERRIPILISIIMDKKPTNLVKRLFGADFRQVGFVRRNAVNSISGIGVFDREVREVLLYVLENDPYYEVRTAAARAVICFADQIIDDKKIEEALLNNLNHNSFEVVREAISALGKIAFSDTAVNRLKTILFSHNWQYRDKAIKAFIDIIERGKYENITELKNYFRDIMVVCTNFKPEFPLKKSILELNKRIQKWS